MPPPPMDTDQEMTEPNLMDNALALGNTKQDDSWAGVFTEKNRQSMMQGLQEPAPPAYEMQAKAYFLALSTALEN